MESWDESEKCSCPRVHNLFQNKALTPKYRAVGLPKSIHLGILYSYTIELHLEYKCNPMDTIVEKIQNPKTQCFYYFALHSYCCWVKSSKWTFSYSLHCVNSLCSTVHVSRNPEPSNPCCCNFFIHLKILQSWTQIKLGLPCLWIKVGVWTLSKIVILQFVWITVSIGLE